MMRVLIVLLLSFSTDSIRAFSLNSSTSSGSSSSSKNSLPPRPPANENPNTNIPTLDPEVGHTAKEDNRNSLIRYRARAAYDGSGFKGWQVQAEGKGMRTVQGEIERALSRRFNRDVKIVGAGRTDAGVHARGQAFHFDIYPGERIINTHGGDFDSEFRTKLQTSMNSMLPKDVRVWNISQCPPPDVVTEEVKVSFESESGSETKIITRRHQWHVIYQATQKLYVYRISMGPLAITTDPLQRYQRVHVEGDINPFQLEKVLKHYEGTHDFRAFAGAIEANQRRDGVENKNTVRTVYEVNLVDEGRGNYRIQILLRGALYKMVRNMVGTALDVCRGRLGEDQMLEMLHQKRKRQSNSDSGTNENGSTMKHFVRKDNKCKPAPPEGLTLEKVYFDDDF